MAERYAGTIDEPLPEPLREKLGLLPLAEALRRIHFPHPDEDALEELDRHHSRAHRLGGTAFAAEFSGTTRRGRVRRRRRRNQIPSAAPTSPPSAQGWANVSAPKLMPPSPEPPAAGGCDG